MAVIDLHPVGPSCRGGAHRRCLLNEKSCACECHKPDAPDWQLWRREGRSQRHQFRCPACPDWFWSKRERVEHVARAHPITADPEPVAPPAPVPVARWPPRVQPALPAPRVLAALYPPAVVSSACELPNAHHDCDERCACVCHELNPDSIGWLRVPMEGTIAGLVDLVGTTDPKQKAWWAAATVLAVWTCGTDHVRIQHALGKQPTLIFHAARRLRSAGIWEDDGTWHALYAEEDAAEEEILELALHVLVAEGKVEAVRHGDGFRYRSTKHG